MKQEILVLIQDYEAKIKRLESIDEANKMEKIHNTISIVVLKSVIKDLQKAIDKSKYADHS